MPRNLNEIVCSWMRLPVKTIDIRQCCTLFPRPHPADTKFKLKPRNNCRCGDRSLRQKLAFKPAENPYRLSIEALQIRGLQCFKLSGNHTENDSYWQKNNFLLFAKCLKMSSLFRICIFIIQKVLLWPKKFFSWKISIWVSKKRRILCWFQMPT